MDVSGKHAASVVRVGEGILIELRDSSETSIPGVISQKTVILII
jgi:hypothetical protein